MLFVVFGYSSSIENTAKPCYADAIIYETKQHTPFNVSLWNKYDITIGYHITVTFMPFVNSLKIFVNLV